MSYHVFAYSGAVGTTANTAINAVADGILTIQNNHFVFRNDHMLLGAVALSANAQRARLISPSLRQIANSHIRPVNASGTIPDNPKVCVLTNNPLKLKAQEELSVDFTSGISSGTETAYVVLFATNDPQPVPQGDIVTLRATGTTTLTSGAWTQVALTYDDTIPAGEFTVVSATFISTNCVAGRLTFDGQYLRSGAPGTTSLGNTEHLSFQTRQYGALGKFRSITPPRCEFLASSGDTAQTVYLSVIRTGS